MAFQISLTVWGNIVTKLQLCCQSSPMATGTFSTRQISEVNNKKFEIGLEVRPCRQVIFFSQVSPYLRVIQTKSAIEISDAIVDTYLTGDAHARVAVETLCTTNRIVLAGEVRGPESITHDKLEAAARAAVRGHWIRARWFPLGKC